MAGKSDKQKKGGETGSTDGWFDAIRESGRSKVGEQSAPDLEIEAVCPLGGEPAQYGLWRVRAEDGYACDGFLMCSKMPGAKKYSVGSIYVPDAVVETMARAI